MKQQMYASDEIKKIVAQKAVTFVQNDMLIGIGSGSTVNYFITSLAASCKKGLKIKAVTASNQSFELAKAHNAKISNRVQQEFAKFVIENTEFWQRNRHAILNPYRTDGLFVKELTNNHLFSVPAPSGCLLLNDESHIYPDNNTIKLTDTNIDNIINNVIYHLARTTEYNNHRYINWDKISEPIPVFGYSYLYDEYKSIIIDYRTDNLSIDDVEFIE